MATFLLLLVISLSYIGLGIPDSLFGTAWPAIYTELNLPLSYAGFVTALISGGTVISSLISARVVKLLGTAKVTLLSTALTAIALLGFSFAPSILWLCLCALPLGLGAGSVDTALNNFVALHYKASHINFLHCFYGVGVSLSPYIMSLLLKNSTWQQGYRTVFIIQASIAAVLLLTLPVWKKFRQESGEDEEENMRILKIRDMLKGTKSISTLLVYIGSCAVESVCLSWGSTFLVDSKSSSPDKAAQIITFYFIGLTLGRFFAGILAKKLSSLKIIFIGEAVTFTAVLTVLFSSSATVGGIGLFLIGLGNGPIFSNMTNLTPQNFGRDVSGSYLGFQMAMASTSFMVSPLIFSFIAGLFGTKLFPYFQLCAFALTAVSTLIMAGCVKKEKI